MKPVNFKKLSLKDIYKWPLLSQLIVGGMLTIVLIFLGVFLVISEQYSDLQQAHQKEEKLKADFSSKIKQAVNLELYRQQLIEITNASDELLRQLPTKTEVEKLLVDINQAGVSRGLKFELFKPNKENMTQYYAELPIDIQVTGTYESLGQFASDLSQLSRVVILKDIQIQPISVGNLRMSAKAQTFRYLDPTELAQMQMMAATKENKDKKPIIPKKPNSQGAK